MPSGSFPRFDPMPATKRPSASEPGYLRWAIAGLLPVAIGIIYGQTLRFGFFDYDDKSSSPNGHRCGQA